MHGAVLILALGCSGGEQARPRDPEPTGDTGLVPIPATVEARCVPTTNALRFECTVTVDPPQPVEIAFAPVDGSLPERVHASDEVAGEHRVPLYLMRGRTHYDFTARTLDGTSVSGTVTTGEVPDPARPTLDLGGTSTAPLLGMASPCQDDAYVVIHDAATGAVLWYEDLARGGVGFVEAVSFTEDQTVLALTDGHVYEVDLVGRPLLDVSPADLPHRVHHDVFRRDGLTYVLFQETVDHAGASYQLDGIYILDGTGARVGEWRLFDHYQPTTATAGPFPDDHSHANAVWVDDAGDIYVSFRHLSAFVKLDGLQRPTFGEIRWRLAGTASSPLGTDLVLAGDFEHQHNVHVLPDGRIALLDNRLSVIERSRVLVLDVDEAAGTATIDQSWELPMHCDFQGSAWFTSAGNPTAACAPYRAYWEFTAGSTEPSYEAEANCPQGIPQYVPRVVPLDW